MINPADHLDIVARVVRHECARGLMPWVDKSDLEDVAQLALVEASRNFQGGDFKAYGYRCVRNAVLLELRRAQHHFGDRGEMPEDCDQQSDSGCRPDIYEALKALPPREYRVVMLFYWGGKSQSEIAGELSVSQPRVAQILAAAQKNLRTVLINGNLKH
jgi:RNA polymerase sigma factor (sigma-70 family)